LLLIGPTSQSCYSCILSEPRYPLKVKSENFKAVVKAVKLLLRCQKLETLRFFPLSMKLDTTLKQVFTKEKALEERLNKVLGGQ